MTPLPGDQTMYVVPYDGPRPGRLRRPPTCLKCGSIDPAFLVVWELDAEDSRAFRVAEGASFDVVFALCRTCHAIPSALRQGRHYLLMQARGMANRAERN